jgi:hypothetical protein
VVRLIRFTSALREVLPPALPKPELPGFPAFPLRAIGMADAASPARDLAKIVGLREHSGLSKAWTGKTLNRLSGQILSLFFLGGSSSPGTPF